MAPEVALGEASVDGRADVYALGCVAYFLLTGTLVFDDPNPMSMALKHVQTPPTRPSERTELPIPPDLEQLIMRCLEKKADARPSGAKELGRLLNDCQVPAWTEESAEAWWERHLPATSSLRVVVHTPSTTPAVVRKV
jgi:serine/threonine-protein kinase